MSVRLPLKRPPRTAETALEPLALTGHPNAQKPQLTHAGRPSYVIELIAIGIGLFFILRFMNEKVPGLNSLVVEVVRQLQARQVAVGASPVAPTRPNMGTVPLTPGEQFSAPPRVDQYPSRQLEEMRLRLIQLENENAGFRAELAVNQQRTLEVQRNAASQIDLARNTDPLRTDL